jgi:carbon-monoxide dehydrogenase medium subunit
MLEPFAIHQPRSAAEASALLARFGAEAAVYAGGTELLVVMKERLAHFPHLIDIKRIPALGEISYDPERREVTIGAVATHRAIERAPVVRERLPALVALEAAVANVRVRVAGTIGGNLCFADPHSDPATLLTALDARLALASSRDARELAVADFFTGFMETARRHEEILTRIIVPEPAAATGVAYERFKLHERPTAAVAAVVTVRDGVIAAARIVAGAVGDRPQLLTAAEAFLRGQAADPAIAPAAAEIAGDEVAILGDTFESDPYKRQLVRTVGRKAIAGAIQRATGEEGARHAA